MVVKISQLKKFLVKDLKKIVKDNKLGAITKKRKPQLISMILDCPQCKDILSKLTAPAKKKKKFSAKQLAAQQRFKEMARARKTDVSPSSALMKKGMSELKDMVMDKGLRFPDRVSKDELVRLVMFGKSRAKDMGGNQMEKELTKSVPAAIVKKATKEIKETMETLIDEKVLEPIENKKKIVAKGKKAFLDSVFGVSSFNLKREIKDIVNEASDEQLEMFLSFSKAKKKEVLEKRFNTAFSIGHLLRNFVK